MAWDSSGSVPARVGAEQAAAQLRRENAELRDELARLRAQPGGGGAEGSAGGAWPTRIDYNKQSVWAGSLLKQLGGVSKQRQETGRIRNSSDFPYLPQPTADEAQLEADFMRWGYCLVKDAMSPAQVGAQVARLVDQAEAERSAPNGARPAPDAQLVANMVMKGQVFRDAVEWSEAACQRGPMVERLLRKILGKDIGLGCAHGSIVHQGGGLQELHIDQGNVPMPYPPWPIGSLIIWCYTDFDLANGGTYIVPGTHRAAGGGPLFYPGADLEALADSGPGMVAVCAPAGTCILTDTRVLHCGGKRTAPGTRYAMRCHYNRGFLRPLHEQSRQNLHVPEGIYDRFSPKLRGLMGIEAFQRAGGTKESWGLLRELSMSRPEELQQAAAARL